jgi:hypothetical protein
MHGPNVQSGGTSETRSRFHSKQTIHILRRIVSPTLFRSARTVPSKGIMGKFKDAVFKGRRQASDEIEQERAGQDAKITAEKAAVAAGNKWITEVLQPVIDAANADLKNEKLAIIWEPGRGEDPSVTLRINKTDTPRGSATGKGLGFVVFGGRQITVYLDGGQQHDLGNTANVKSQDIEELLMSVLQVGSQLARGDK